jgi:DNA-binding transcriptional LysR family regulator
MQRLPADYLAALTGFVRTAEAGSFSEAGRALGLSPSAVSKSVARLETLLGVRLLHRTTRSLRLTPEGELFLLRGRAILSDVVEAQAEVMRAGAALGGRLRIDMPVNFGVNAQMMGLVARFAAAYPAIELDLSFNDRFVDMVAEGIDLVFRVGLAPDAGFVARTLAKTWFAVAASPAYLERRGAPRTMEDLGAHECIGFVLQSSGRPLPWRFWIDRQVRIFEPKSRLRVNETGAQVALAKQGLGLIYGVDMELASSFAEGSLVPVLADIASRGPRVQLVYPARRLLPLRVRAFIDFALAETGASAAGLSAG